MSAGRRFHGSPHDTNTTANDMVAPLLDISSTNTNVLFSTPDDPNNFTPNAQVLAVAPNGSAGILRAGQSGSLTLTLLSNDTEDGDALPVEVDQIEAGRSMDWTSQQLALQQRLISAAVLVERDCLHQHVSLALDLEKLHLHPRSRSAVGCVQDVCRQFGHRDFQNKKRN